MKVELAGIERARHRWFFGGYPPVHALRSFATKVDWLDGYVTTFLERDIPALGLAGSRPRATTTHRERISSQRCLLEKS